MPDEKNSDSVELSYDEDHQRIAENQKKIQSMVARNPNNTPLSAASDKFLSILAGGRVEQPLMLGSSGNPGSRTSHPRKNSVNSNQFKTHSGRIKPFMLKPEKEKERDPELDEFVKIKRPGRSLPEVPKSDPIMSTWNYKGESHIAPIPGPDDYPAAPFEMLTKLGARVYRDSDNYPAAPFEMFNIGGKRKTGRSQGRYIVKRFDGKNVPTGLTQKPKQSQLSKLAKKTRKRKFIKKRRVHLDGDVEMEEPDPDIVMSEPSVSSPGSLTTFRKPVIKNKKGEVFYKGKKVKLPKKGGKRKREDLTAKWKQVLQDSEMWEKDDKNFNRQMSEYLEEKHKIEKEQKLEKAKEYLADLRLSKKRKKEKEYAQMGEKLSKMTEGVSQANHSFVEDFGQGVVDYYKDMYKKHEEDMKGKGFWGKVWGGIKLAAKSTLAPAMSVISAFGKSYKGSDVQSAVQIAGNFDPKMKMISTGLDAGSSAAKLMTVKTANDDDDDDEE